MGTLIPGTEGQMWFMRIALVLFVVLLGVDKFSGSEADNDEETNVVGLMEKAEKKAKEASGWLDNKIETYLESEDGKVLQAFVAARMAQEKAGSDNLALVAAQRNSDRPYFSDVKSGDGAQAVCGGSLKLHYKLYDKLRNIVDNTYDFDDSVEFTPGDGSLPPGLERAVPGMRVGGVRRIVVPGALAFDGKRYRSSLIMPGEPVIYLAELISVAPRMPAPVLIQEAFGPKSAYPGALCGRSVTLRIEGARKHYVKTLILGREAVLPVELVSALSARAQGGELSFAFLHPESVEAIDFARWLQQEGKVTSSSKVIPYHFYSANSPESLFGQQEKKSEAHSSYHIRILKVE